MIKLCVVFLAVVFLAVEGRKFLGTKLDDYCWSNDQERLQKWQFSSKTAYQLVKGDPSLYSSIPNCIPQKFWLVSRHGTRLPGAKHIAKYAKLHEFQDEVIANFQNGKGTLCAEDFELLRNWNWNPNITEQFDEYLVDQGWNDLKLLGQSYQRAFPSILPDTYSSDDFFFRHTDTQRTEASYKAYADGLFGENAYENIPAPEVPFPDYLLRPQDNCQSWQDKDDSTGDAETDKFEHSDFYTTMILEVSQRLGFETALSADQIETLYNLCRYEQSWYLDETSAWCAAFTPEHILILEYAEDLKYYYKAGYGSEVNYGLTCDLIADFIQNLEDLDSPTSALFTHSTTMHLLLVSMGVLRDEVDLRADNFELHRDNRKWRSSVMGPFTTNMAVIKYECPNEEVTEKALFLMNEKPMEIDWCENGLCSWADVKENYSKYITADCRDVFCPDLK